MRYVRVFLIEVIMLLSIVGDCQSTIKITPVNVPISLKWSYDSVFNIQLNVTNYTDSMIVIPGSPYAVDKNRMGNMDIGVKMKLVGKKVQYCAASVQYLIIPKLISINPKETKVITVHFGGDCFVKKGKYKIKFFFKTPFIKNGKKYYKNFSSKKVEVNLV